MRSINCYTDTRLKGGAMYIRILLYLFCRQSYNMQPTRCYKCLCKTNVGFFNYRLLRRKTNWNVELRKLQGYQIAKFIRCAEHKYIL